MLSWNRPLNDQPNTVHAQWQATSLFAPHKLLQIGHAYVSNFNVMHVTHTEHRATQLGGTVVY
jgi:hypothetical protein